MLFVTQDKDSKIVAVSHEPEERAQEEVPAVYEDPVEFFEASVR